MTSSEIYSLFLLGNSPLIIQICFLLAMVCTSVYKKIFSTEVTSTETE